MAEAPLDGTDGAARALSRRFEPVHSISYYSPELTDLTDLGYRGWWHAYFGYRPAPMGPVGAGVVTAAFYNFAPRMVGRAVPGVWSILAPADAVRVRHERVAAALSRLSATPAAPTDAAAAVAGTIRAAVADLPVAGRPLYAAYAELAWPDDPLMAVWHGCTLAREYRGDGHNLALAGSGVDGVECHVLMAARGFGNRPTILGIRGWTEEEWAAAVDRLRHRGWLDGEGVLTRTGRTARATIESRTDELARPLVSRLGADGVATVVAGLDPLVTYLRDTGEVSGRWPPPTVTKPDTDGADGSGVPSTDS
ncbi:MAG: SCO6745 family protein [Acidimicrobiales bacterium]